tara:strand:+ start:501 stop:1073 length:573 start_codon:yes stop_codon:yes gene_type:complete
MNDIYFQFLKYFPKTIPTSDINLVSHEDIIKEIKYSYLKTNSIFPLKFSPYMYNRQTLDNLYILRNIFNDVTISDEIKMNEIINMYNNWGEKQHNILLPQLNNLILELIKTYNTQKEMVKFYNIIQKQIIDEELEDITKNISSFDKVNKPQIKSPRKIIKKKLLKSQNKKKSILDLDKLYLFGNSKIKKK